MTAERRQRLEAIGFEWDPLAIDWEGGFAALETFRAREGHCRVPQVHVESGYRLGKWVARQRKVSDTMPAERRQRLEAIGFEWNLLANNDWERRIATLEKFKAREGHCRVPQGHVEGGFKLGSWVSNQRNAEGTLPAERKHQLDAVGFEWDPLAIDWERGFAALEAFREREGHCRVPAGLVDGGFKLGNWVSVWRQGRDKLSIERRQRLAAIGFEWDPLVSNWERGFAALEKFRAREGHCRVPVLHVEDEFRLGSWVSVRRKVRDIMPADRRQQLDALGFDWDPLASNWETGLAALEKFCAREGHCRVPRGHVEGGFKLGNWTNNQRNARKSMPTERKQRLEAVGFEWADRRRSRLAPPEQD